MLIQALIDLKLSSSLGFHENVLQLFKEGFSTL